MPSFLKRTLAKPPRTLVDKLVAMGFEEDEASENIEYVQPGFEFGERVEFPEAEETPDLTFRFSLAKNT